MVWVYAAKRRNDWVKKCMEYKVAVPGQRKLGTEIVKKDCQARKLNKGDVMNRKR